MIVVGILQVFSHFKRVTNGRQRVRPTGVTCSLVNEEGGALVCASAPRVEAYADSTSALERTKRV
jgi:hypothetical protein